MQIGKKLIQTTAQLLSQIYSPAILRKKSLQITNQTNQQLAGKVELLLLFNSAGLKAIAIAIQSGSNASASIDINAIKIIPYAISAQKR